MQLQSFNPADVTVNPGLLARKGAPDKKKVAELATNMLERREAGRPHQIQPGVVRISEDGTVECYVGQHRLAAEAHLNTMVTDGMEPFEFYAIAVPSTDEQALIDAIEENAWREATTPDDKAYAMQVLADLGQTQDQIAKHFKLKSTSTVSEFLRYGKLPSKYKKMVRDGTMTEEAALVVARYNKDPKTQEEVAELALQIRASLDDIQARADAKAKAEEDAKAESKAEKGAKGKAKAAEAAEEPAEAEEGAPAKKAKSTVPVSEAVKGKKAAGGKKATPGKVTASDVKDATKKLGVKKKKSTAPAKMSVNAFLTMLAALFGPNVEEVPEPIALLVGKIEARIENDISDTQMKNAFIKCCKEDFD